MQNNNPNDYYQENKINLIEVISVLSASKKIIIITTLIFTLIATGYVYSIKPSYIASSVIKIGFYTDINNNKLPIKSLVEVVDDLTLRFIELPKYKSDLSNLTSISSIGSNQQSFKKQQQNLLQQNLHQQEIQYIVLKAIANLPNLAINKIEVAQQYLINNHQTIIDKEIKEIELLIISIKEEIAEHYEELEFINQNIAIQKNYLELYKLQKLDIESEISSIEAFNPSFSTSHAAAIRSIEKRELVGLIAHESLTLNQMNNSKMELKSIIQDKLNEIVKLELVMKKENHSNSSIFKKIVMVPNNLRNKIIISLAAITGFLLSTLILFFRQALLQEQKERNLQ